MTRRDKHQADDDTQWFAALRADAWDGATWEDASGQPRRTEETRPLENYRPEPASFPALDPRETGPMQRMPRINRVRERPRPARPADAALFLFSDLLGQHIMLCGVCPKERRARFADPIAGHMPFGFEALRTSAYVSGWRLDAYARWACPACQMTSDYHAPYGVVHYDVDAAEAYMAGDRPSERAHRDRAEHDLIADVTMRAGRYRHAGSTR